MHPLGFVFAFAAFGLVGGLGLFIAGNTASGLFRLLRRSQQRQSPIMFVYSSLLLAGLAMIVAGGYATYRVIYG